MLLLALLSGSNLAAGVALQFTGVFVLGAGPSTDAYFAAQTLPMILGAIFSGALLNNLTPLLASLDKQRGNSLIRAVMLRVAPILLLLILLFLLTAKWWAALLFSGLGDVASDQFLLLLPVMCLTFGIAVLASAAIAGHYAHGVFLRVEGVQLTVSLVALIIVEPVAGRFGVVGFAGLLFLRALIVFLVVGSAFLFAVPLQGADLTRKLWARMAQILTGSVIFKLGPVVDRSLATFAIPGALTSIGIGQQVAGSCASVTERVLSRPLMVAAGARAESSERHQILALYRRQLRIVGWSSVVALLGAAALFFLVSANQPVAHILHLRAFGQTDLILLVALTAIPAAASQLSSSLMYAIGDTRTISRLAILSFVISTLVKVVGFVLFGIYAIVAGIFLYQALNWLSLHVAATRALRVPSAHNVARAEEPH